MRYGQIGLFRNQFMQIYVLMLFCINKTELPLKYAQKFGKNPLNVPRDIARFPFVDTAMLISGLTLDEYIF